MSRAGERRAACRRRGPVSISVGDASDLPSEVLADIAAATHRGEIDRPIEVYAMDDIARAHDDVEHNRATAKQVCSRELRPGPAAVAQ